MISALLQRDPTLQVYASYCRTVPPAALQKFDRLHWAQVDLTCETAIADWLQPIETIHWLINCAGTLHTPEKGPEKSLREVDADFFSHNMQTNCLPTLLLAKHSVAKFKLTAAANALGKPALFATVSAKVGSIDDNRLGGWYSYRASKAALNMSLKSISIEWQRQMPHICVAALHPGTTDTALSKPFQKNVAAQTLFDPDYAANRLLSVLDGLSAGDTGRFWSWNGDELPW